VLEQGLTYSCRCQENPRAEVRRVSPDRHKASFARCNRDSQNQNAMVWELPRVRRAIPSPYAIAQAKTQRHLQFPKCTPIGLRSSRASPAARSPVCDVPTVRSTTDRGWVYLAMSSEQVGIAGGRRVGGTSNCEEHGGENAAPPPAPRVGCASGSARVRRVHEA
jgi:hypothetical protein